MMTSINAVEFKKYNGFLNIILSNEKQRNCLSPHMMQQFIDILKNQLCSNCRFVLIQAKGIHFCAGADLEWMKKQKDNSLIDNYVDSIQLQSFFEAIYNIPVPVVSYAQGASYGGGVGLIAASDYVIAEPEASFCLSEVKLGLVPAVISPFVISKIGISWFTALSTSAKVIKAQQAMSIALVHEIATEELMKSSIEERAISISKNFLVLSPQALKENKKIIRHISDPVVLNNEKQNLNRVTITKLRASAEGIEGMSSLLEKRSPNWIIKA